MKRDFPNYKGYWFKFPQTVGELINYLEQGTSIKIHYDELTCPKTAIIANQLGEPYKEKVHYNYQVSYWSVKTKGQVVITVKVDKELIPQKLIDHSENRKPFEQLKLF